MVVQTRKSAGKSSGSKRGRSNDGNDDASVVRDASHNILISPRPNEFSERTWWLVDVEQEDAGEGDASNQGATALVKRCMRSHGWSLEKARKILTAYRQFLTLKKEREDWDATILSPSLLVDQMWHQHILDVVNYCHDMMLLCGRVVGHNPDGALDGKAERDATTRQALEERFPNFDKEIWGGKQNDATNVTASATANNAANKSITISIKDQTGEETMFKVKGTTKMGKVYSVFAARKGVCRSHLRFYLGGDLIGDWDATPEMLGLDDNDQISCFFSQSGC